MSAITIAAPATAARVAPNYGRIDTAPYDTVVLSAPGLATTEEVDIYVQVPGGYALWGVLTATAQAKEVPVGPTYALLKDATAGSVGLYASVTAGGR
jgi:hypothetical protein